MSLREEKPLSAEAVGLVAIDLDGTLLGADNSVSVAAAEAIAEVMERGVKVVIATGRAPRQVRSIAEGLGLTTLQVAHNGALICDPVRNGFVFHEPLPSDLARAVVMIARHAQPRVPMALEIIDRCVMDRSDPELAMLQGVLGSEGFEQALESAVTKIMMAGEPEALGDVQFALMQQLGTRVSFAFSHLRLLQVMHGRADKAMGLARVAAHYKISRQGVMAIGDAPNDVGMLRWAGLGVAASGAFEDVRKAANFVVPPGESDPVHWAIRRFVLAG